MVSRQFVHISATPASMGSEIGAPKCREVAILIWYLESFSSNEAGRVAESQLPTLGQRVPLHSHFAGSKLLMSSNLAHSEWLERSKHIFSRRHAGVLTIIINTKVFARNADAIHQLDVDMDETSKVPTTMSIRHKSNNQKIVTKMWSYSVII